MARINVSGLTFYYEGSFDNIFENVSFAIDTDWKLGFIGRNGKGKTTFLNLLLGKYEYQGSINTSTVFEYFPFEMEAEWMNYNTIDVIEHMDTDYELWKICRELDLLQADSELLYRPYITLSHGERTKIMLTVLFAKEQHFLLIDEPTNHLDMPTRELLVDYLKHKKGYILVSHDRWFMDQCVDHVLVLNRNTIEVEKGNFSSWWENKQKKDAFELAENEKLKKEITKLTASARQRAMWADKVEATKIGFDPVREHDRFLDTRAYIAAKSKKQQKQSKQLEQRSAAAIEDKKSLLKDLEENVDLKLIPLNHHKEIYIECRDYSVGYQPDSMVIKHLTMKLSRGDRMIIQGKNGCGKSTFIKAILQQPGIVVLNQPTLLSADLEKEQPIRSAITSDKDSKGSKDNKDNKDNRDSKDIKKAQLCESGTLETASGLIISYINQDTSFLCGRLEDYIEKCGVEESLFKAILRQLDFERVQFEKPMEAYSEGQKKKVLIAGSILQQAHLYIWDEPLNYIDVFSRMQIEQLIMKYKPTMLLVEHDRTFSEKVATKVCCDLMF